MEQQPPPPVDERPVQIHVGPVALEGTLAVPEPPRGVVLFAHGSGSSRHSPRNRYVAQALQRAGLATLLLDLLSADEEAVDARTAQHRFDIGLLTARLLGATDWLAHDEDTAGLHRLKLGYFGASTGAGAALLAAAQRPRAIGAVVSRGGRPDLAGAALARVRAPTLLIVGERDVPVIELNEAALARLDCVNRLAIVPKATHLFEEPGTLGAAAALARDWFLTHLRPG